MRILVHSVVIIVGAALGLAVGFAWRGKQASLDQAGAPTAGRYGSLYGKPGKPAKAGTPKSDRLNDDSPLATKLEHDLSMSSGVTRWLHWVNALEKAAPGDFPRLFQLARDNPVARRFVAARWAEVAPRHMFGLLVAASKGGNSLPVNELANILFTEWPKRDPDGAIDALSKGSDFALRPHWRFEVAYAMVDQDIERALRLMADWHADDIGFGPSGIAAVSKWARKDPRHAAEFLFSQPPGYSVQSTIDTVGKEWAKIDPVAALEYAKGRPGELSSVLAASAIKEWASKNVGDVADWLAATDDRTRNRLSPAFVEAWAKQDTDGAMSWCAENLTGTSLARAVAGLMRGAAEKDVTGAAALVTGMEPSHARTEAALAVANKWFPNLSSDTRAGPEAVAWLGNLDGDTVKRVVEEVAWGWATSDPRGMAAFIAQSSSDRVPPYAYELLGRELARKSPSESLDWANQLPEDRKLSGGGAAFAEWRSSQPEAAMKWLNELPSSDPRQKAYFESVVRSLAYHPQAAEQLAAMTTAQQTTARGVIEGMSLPADRRSRLMAALNAP
jgi:hypothetical protein